MWDLIGQDSGEASPPVVGGISLAVYRVDASGTHLVKPRHVVGTEAESPTWPFTRGITGDREPPCRCTPDCRYLHGTS